MDIQIQGWQLSMIVGSGTFAGLSLYNRFTQDPDEINTNSYMLKASTISAIIVIIASCVLTSKGNSMPSERRILMNFESPKMS